MAGMAGRDEGHDYLGPIGPASLVAGKDGQPQTHPAPGSAVCRKPLQHAALTDGGSLSSLTVRARQVRSSRRRTPKRRWSLHRQADLREIAEKEAEAVPEWPPDA